MPLLVARLEQGILKARQVPNPRPSEVAARLSTAYAEYAQTASANGIPPLLTASNTKIMQAILLPALQVSPPGTLFKLADTFSRAILGFWTGVTFGPGVFTLLSSSLCSSCIVAGGGFPSAPQAAKSLARCLHSATKTGIVSFPPPLGPVPLL